MILKDMRTFNAEESIRKAWERIKREKENGTYSVFHGPLTGGTDEEITFTPTHTYAPYVSPGPYTTYGTNPKPVAEWPWLRKPELTLADKLALSEKYAEELQSIIEDQDQIIFALIDRITQLEKAIKEHES